MADDGLAVALGAALTGERLPLTSPHLIGAELAGLGFDRERLAALRSAAQEAEEPWPFPVSLHERRAVGFARFDAALADARRLLGLDGLRSARPAVRPLDREEQRLAADRPPHWG